MTDFFVDDRLRPSNAVGPRNAGGALSPGAFPPAPGSMVRKDGTSGATPVGTPHPSASPSSGSVNINAGAPGNPLDTLLAGRNPYGQLGGLLVSQGAGYTTEGSDTVYGQGFIGPNDPRYALAQQDLSSRGLVQLRNTNIGGPGEAIDPSKVTYDPQYGLVTTADNVKPFGSDIGGWGPFALAAIPAAAIAAGALAGGGAESTAGIASTDAAESGGTLALNAAGTGVTPYAGAASTADALTPTINSAISPSASAPVTQGGGTVLPGAGPGTQAAAPVIDHSINAAAGAGTTSLGSSVVNAITSHPLQAAGLAMSAASALGNKPSIPANAGNVNANTDPNSPANQNANAMIASNGKPTTDQAAAIDATIEEEWNRGREQIIQASVNAGQGGTDSMVVQDKLRAFRTQLDTQKMQMYQSQAAQNMQNALAELGQVNSAQFQLAELQLQQDQIAQQRTMQIMESLGWLFSFGGGF